MSCTVTDRFADCLSTSPKSSRDDTLSSSDRERCTDLYLANLLHMSGCQFTRVFYPTPPTYPSPQLPSPTSRLPSTSNRCRHTRDVRWNRRRTARHRCFYDVEISARGHDNNASGSCHPGVIIARTAEPRSPHAARTQVCRPFLHITLRGSRPGSVHAAGHQKGGKVGGGEV